MARGVTTPQVNPEAHRGAIQLERGTGPAGLSRSGSGADAPHHAEAGVAGRARLGPVDPKPMR
jgi:hypothetical protein